MTDDITYKVLIIDDEPAAIDMLVNNLKDYPDFRVEGIAINATTGIKQIRTIQPDLLFLDVEMPDMYGMELLSVIKNDIDWSMRVVFHTAYDKYVIDALRSSAFDFLLKPVVSEELRSVLSRFIEEYGSDKNSQLNRNQVSHKSNIPFMVTTPTGDLRMLKTSEIGFFRYVNNKKIWEAILVSGETLSLKDTVQNFV